MRRPKATFSSTVYQGNTPCSWKTKAGRSSDARTTSPAVAVSRPPRTRSSVDFPQPDGPRMHTNSPFSTPRETWFSATVVPAAYKKTLELSRASLARSGVVTHASR